MMSVPPFRPQTPITSASRDDYSSPQVQDHIPAQHRASSGEEESDHSDAMSLDIVGDIHSTRVLNPEGTSADNSEVNDNIQRTIDAYNHICEQTMEVASEIASKFKHRHLVHLSAPAAEDLYNVIISWKKPLPNFTDLAMRRRVAYFAAPDDFFTSLIAAFFVLEVCTDTAVSDVGLSDLTLDWDTWIDFEEPLIERAADGLAERLASVLVHHIFYDDEEPQVTYPEAVDFIAGISSGLVRKALVFGLCVPCSDNEFSWPAAGGRFHPGTMRTVDGGEVSRVNDRACLLTVFPGVAIPTIEEDRRVGNAEDRLSLEAIIVLEEEASYWT